MCESIFFYLANKLARLLIVFFKGKYQIGFWTDSMAL